MTTNIVNGFYADDLEITIDQQGEGRPLILLHGGGGPPSMGALPSALAETFEVIAPVHPGFAGTPRPEWYVGIDDIALTYVQLLEQRNLRDVLVVGSSIGGWIASEMAVRAHERISGTVLLNAVGINVDGIELADFFTLWERGLPLGRLLRSHLRGGIVGRPHARHRMLGHVHSPLLSVVWSELTVSPRPHTSAGRQSPG